MKDHEQYYDEQFELAVFNKSSESKEMQKKHGERTERGFIVYSSLILCRGISFVWEPEV